LKLLFSNPSRPERLNQILDAPIDADARKEGQQTKKDQKNDRLFKEQAIIEDISQLFEPFNIDSKGEKKSYQKGERNQVEEKEPISFSPRTLLRWEDKREMEKKQGRKSQTHEDHLHPKDGPYRIDAADHNQLTQIPGSKGKDETSKKPMSDISGFTGKNDQTKGEVHRKGEGCGKG